MAGFNHLKMTFSKYSVNKLSYELTVVVAVRAAVVVQAVEQWLTVRVGQVQIPGQTLTFSYQIVTLFSLGVELFLLTRS